MTEMVEKVARAIFIAAKENSSASWEGHISEARAAIEAMRTPTKAMLEVGPPFPYMDEYVWKTMIDEALK
jgi:hypothetical protein